MSIIRVRAMSGDDWSLYKSLRLESLKESPDAFAATYMHECSYSDQEWKLKLSTNGRVFSAHPLVALLDGSPSGIALGVIHNQDDTVAHLYQMWVMPKHRGHGVGKALLSAVIDWAKENSLTQLILGVTSTNSTAVGLYSAAGFQVHGALKELRSDSELKVQSMLLRIVQNSA